MWQKQHAFNLTWCSRSQAGDDGCSGGHVKLKRISASPIELCTRRYFDPLSVFIKMLDL